jgi:hypothetical protein
MGRITREESLEDIISEIMCLDLLSAMKFRYKNTGLGYGFEDCHKMVKTELMKMVRFHKKEFKEDLDMKVLRKL